MRNDPLTVLTGAVVALTFFCLCGFVVWRIGHVTPGRLTAVLAALGALIAALPPILRVLRG